MWTAVLGVTRLRDEKKQDDMRHELQAKHPENAKKVKFYIGDVRNPQSIRDAMPGVDYIFHAAALKQVPSCEFFPIRSIGIGNVVIKRPLDAFLTSHLQNSTNSIV